MKDWFCNLKFHYKLLFGTIAITTLSLLLISQLSYSYFYKRNVREVIEKAETSTRMASASLSSQFNSIAAASNMLLVKAPFPKMIYDINTGNFPGYSKYFADASTAFNIFGQNQDAVSEIILCGEDGTFLSQAAIGSRNNLEDLFPEKIWNFNRFKVLPTRFNTLTRRGMVIPIVYPISSKSVGAESALSYQDDANQYKVRYIILMDSAQINAYFDRLSNGYTYRMYLADEDGTPLDITSDKYPDAFLPEIRKWVADVDYLKEEELTLTNGNLLMTANKIGFCNLKIVHITQKSALTGDAQELRHFFIGTWFICTLLSCIMAIVLSHFLTRKIKVLGNIITRINHRNYKDRIEFPHSDEISLLGCQLNQMYDTIQLQLEQIQQEEQKKAKAEIQMLSEQINPHFLYNTLECIHFQTLNGNSKTAGAMLESLGRYLRITLSVGSTMIPLQREAEHVTAYMEIMNRHSDSGIQFQCQLDSRLKDYNVIKILLQPLAENSIKHGFDGMISKIGPIPPKIQIFISLEESQNSIHIEVADNGKGIDIEKATACLLETIPDSKKHFGLHNIQKRLTACYGEEAKITFSSIPYFKNSVIISIPYKIFS